MANDTPQTPAAPALPANYDPNSGTIAAEPVDLTDHVARAGGRTIGTATDDGGFLPTLSKTSLGTAHPIEQAESEIKQLREHPVDTLESAAKTAVMLPVNVAYSVVHHPIDTITGLTGGPEFSAAAAKKDIPGMVGAVAGGFINAENPEERGLDPEDIEIAGGKTIVPPTPRAAEHPTEMMSPEDFIKKTSAHEGHVYPDTVKNYQTKIQKGEPLEPLEIHYDTAGNIVGANGRHRAGAAVNEKLPLVPVRHVTIKPPEPEERLDLGEIGTAEKAERPPTVWKSSAVVDPKIQNIVEGTGGVYRGQNKDGIVEITLPLSMTHDLPLNESFKKVVSVTLPANEVTPESVKAAMIRKRAEFLPK